MQFFPSCVQLHYTMTDFPKLKPKKGGMLDAYLKYSQQQQEHCHKALAIMCALDNRYCNVYSTLPS
jgi:hypothetical protein